MSGIAYPLLVLAMTGSAAKAGIVGGAGLLANMLFLLPAGLVADRFPRRKLMVLTSLIQLAAVGSVVPVVLANHIYIAQLAAVAAVQGAASAFYLGASRGAVRRVVPVPQLSAAYSRIQGRDQAISLIGPPAGGALFGLARFLPFAFDSASFGVVALAAALIRAPLDPERRPERRPAHLLAGLRFIAERPVLRTVAIWGAVVNTTAAGVFLCVVALARSLGADPALVGLVTSVNSVSGLVGSLLAAKLIKRIGARNLTWFASWLLALGAVGLSRVPSPWLIGGIGIVIAFFVAPVNVAFGAYSAAITPDELQAQAGNAMKLWVSGFAWLSPPAFGTAIGILGVRPALLIAAAFYAVAAVTVQFARNLGELDRYQD